ncbi:hypothetical protein SLEP1_g14415 [Rubroshorea leprosula]|uniref:Cytochrome P450 n=1 Tax=Rubroshorea leprosula TaxID=152421 RepID=A0AAV5IUE9_9ROSI|nr:hypothetical protein SLEP1_g14415 [Rubroshorea leprosula]
MSPATLTLFLLLLASLYSFFHILRAVHRKCDRKLPPGPRALPIIGNLHMLGNLPHQTLYQLAKKYGPIMSLRLGNLPTVVLSSPSAAELFLKTHDLIFASRPKLQAIEYMAYNSKGMIFAEYGSYWRDIKKLVTLELLSPSKIEFFGPIRRAELGCLVESLRRAAAAGEVVDLSDKVRELAENMVYKMILGRSKDERFKLKESVAEGLNLSGGFNIADYVPWLGALDLQRLIPRFKAVSKHIDTILETIINEHEQDFGQRQQKDFVDILLLRMNQHMSSHDNSQELKLDRTKLKAVILDMIAAAFDTSSTTIEWALSELQRHPQVKLKLQKELEEVVGMDKIVEETDLGKLNYLDLVVKETFRLHPAVPLLLPHESTEDITVNGYDIPKKSRILVNAWAIGRDPVAWSENAQEFFPERFIGRDMDVRGHDFQLIPFGSGRRGCPGLQLGVLTVKYVLAQLVHCFDLELADGMFPSGLDMTEKFGLTLPRANHLLVKPTYRLVNM